MLMWQDYPQFQAIHNKMESEWGVGRESLVSEEKL